jgi:hypothetical protein
MKEAGEGALTEARSVRFLRETAALKGAQRGQDPVVGQIIDMYSRLTVLCIF